MKFVYLAIATFLLAVSMILPGCTVSDRNNGTFTEGQTSVLPPITENEICLNGKALYAEKSGFENDIAVDPDKVNSLVLTNNGYTEMKAIVVFSSEITFLSDGTVPFGKNGICLSALPGEKAAAEFRAGAGHVSVAYFSKDGISAAFACDYAGFELALSDRSFGYNIVTAAAIRTDKQLDITRPCRITVDGGSLCVADTVYVCYDDSEGFEIVCSDTGIVDFDAFFADTPKAELVLPEKLAEKLFPKSYYLRAKTINGEELRSNYKEIVSDKALADLVDDSRLPRLIEGDTLYFSEESRISDGHRITAPVDFVFDDESVINGKISVGSSDECMITLKASGKFASSPPIVVDSDRVDVVWNDCGLNIYEICRLWNFRTVNGRRYSDGQLGGDSDASDPDVRMLQGKNNIAEDIQWISDGYLLRARISCVADPSALGQAVLSLGCKNGSISCGDSVNLLDPLGVSLTLTDKNGKSSKYLIVTEYVPTKLPVIVINTEVSSGMIPRDEYVNGTIRINCDYADGFSGIGTSSIQIRGRGNSTWKWEKKPYKIKFDKKTSVLGLEKAKKWVLLANYSDKSLIRNTLAFSAAAFLSGMKYAPTQYPVDLFLNGRYVGVYSIGEQIEAKKGRVELEDNGTDPDTGYLIELGGTSAGDVWDVTCFFTELSKYAKIKAPDESTLTVEQVAYIKDYFTKAEEAIIAGSGYEEYIDIDALIDWFLLHELSYNLDSSFRRSCYITKDAGGKLTMGPAWDFDLAFGNFTRDKLDGKGWACLYDNGGYLWPNWMTYLLSDQAFITKLSARWEEIGKPLVEYLISEIDRLYELVSPSAKYNFKVWNILNRKVGYQPYVHVKYNTYELQMTFLKEYITKRAAWMTENVSVVVNKK